MNMYLKIGLGVLLTGVTGFFAEKIIKHFRKKASLNMKTSEPQYFDMETPELQYNDDVTFTTMLICWRSPKVRAKLYDVVECFLSIPGKRNLVTNTALHCNQSLATLERNLALYTCRCVARDPSLEYLSPHEAAESVFEMIAAIPVDVLASLLNDITNGLPDMLVTFIEQSKINGELYDQEHSSTSLDKILDSIEIDNYLLDKAF